MAFKEYRPEKPVSKTLQSSQSLSASECPKCHEVFSSVSYFDKHLKRVSWTLDKYRMLCQDPKTLKMELNKRGHWTIPQENEWWKDQ